MLPIKREWSSASFAPTYLTESELNRLTETFQEWYDQSPQKWRRSRGKKWLLFLLLRYSGARLSEAIQVDDSKDIDWRSATIRIPTLKRRRPLWRTVFVPEAFLAELGRFLAEWPQERGRVFRQHVRPFQRVFHELSRKAGIDPKLCHVHVLRHTRAIEMIKSGVPLTLVQQLLGHASLTTTAVYLQIFQSEARQILKERGLI